MSVQEVLDRHTANMCDTILRLMAKHHPKMKEELIEEGLKDIFQRHKLREMVKTFIHAYYEYKGWGHSQFQASIAWHITTKKGKKFVHVCDSSIDAMESIRMFNMELEHLDKEDSVVEVGRYYGTFAIDEKGPDGCGGMCVAPIYWDEKFEERYKGDYYNSSPLFKQFDEELPVVEEPPKEDLPIFDAQVFYNALRNNLMKVINIGADGKAINIHIGNQNGRRQFDFGSYTFVEDTSIGGMGVFDRSTKANILFIKNGVIYDIRDENVSMIVGKM